MADPNPIFAGIPNYVAESRPGVAIVASSEANAKTPATNLRSSRLYRPWISATFDVDDRPSADASLSWDYGGVDVVAGHVGLYAVDFPTESEFKLELFSGPVAGAGDPVKLVDWSDTWYPYTAAGPGGEPWGTFTWGNKAPLDVLQNFQRNIISPLLDDAGEILQPVRHQSGRISLRLKSSGVISQDYWQAGYLEVSDAWMASCPPTWGRSRDAREWFEAERGPAGHLKATRRGTSVAQSFVLSALNQVEAKHRIARLNAEIGTTAALTVILEPHHPENFYLDAGLYRLVDTIRVSRQPFYKDGSPIWQTSAIAMEAWR